MNAPSDDIRDIIEAAGDSSGFSGISSDIFIGKEPSEPKNCVTIFDTHGYPPALGLRDQGYEYPSVQIRVRNIKYKDGWAIINNIKNLLHGLYNQQCNGSLYTVIYCSSGPALLDWDDNGNARFIINFNLQRR